MRCTTASETARAFPSGWPSCFMAQTGLLRLPLLKGNYCHGAIVLRGIGVSVVIVT